MVINKNYNIKPGKVKKIEKIFTDIEYSLHTVPDIHASVRSTLKSIVLEVFVTFCCCITAHNMKQTCHRRNCHYRTELLCLFVELVSVCHFFNVEILSVCTLKYIFLEKN